MAKSTADRLNETITFIRGHRPDSISDETHTQIVRLLEVWNNRAASQRSKDTLSGLMSQEGAVQRASTKEARAYVRAATMVQCAIVLPERQWAEIAGQGRATAQNHDNLYESALKAARDYIGSTPSEINAMLRRLRDDPIATLNSQKFTINGGNKAGNPVTFKVAVKDGAYSFDCYGTNRGRVEVSAMNVKATKYNDVRANPGAIEAVESGAAPGADMLLTTQFTGCSFCFMKTADETGIHAAHIDPGMGPTGVSGTALSETMRDDAGFSNATDGELKVYGRVANGSETFGYPEAAAQMTIIGLKDGPNWRLYSQITGLDGSLTAQRIDV